jgi:ribose transport system ATP-binding protein
LGFIALMTATSPPLLDCRGISKRFGGETALDGVDFTICAGEVHGLVGSNGAGKSTLMKILAGALPDHEGQVLLNGRPADLSSPQAALAQGIAMVYQELSGIGQLSVAENLFLGRQPVTRLGRIDWPGMRARAAEYLRELEIDLDVTRRLESYPLVVRQMVEIARGLHSGARVLILDEPTSALSPPEARRLFALVDRLRKRGVAVVFISHFIEDVLEICDRVTILKSGRRLETSDAATLEKHYVIHTMLGHSLAGSEVGYEAGIALPPRTATPPRLQVRDLSLAGAFSEVNVEVSPGECLGIYGFVGAGHQELLECIAGARRADRGQVLLDGRPLRPGQTNAAVRRGVVLVASDRGRSLVQTAEIYKNVTLAHLAKAVGPWLARRKESAIVAPLLDRVGCKPAVPTLPVASLSGGNQQKVVLARWLLGPVRVLLLDEPTRGMDVGAKDEIMRLVAREREAGAAVLLASSEPEMVLAHAQRIIVMSRGAISHEFADKQVDKPTLMRHA